MAKAADESTTTWILLSEAKALAVEIYGAPHLAERLIREALAAGSIRWRCLRLEGQRQPSDPGEGSSEFWRREAHPGSRQWVLHIAWAENWARRGGTFGFAAFGIELAHADLLRLLPQQSAPNELPPTGTAVWIAAEAKRMKRDGEIGEGTRITDFAKLLEKRMRKAADANRSLRAVGWRYIKNQLPVWDLWPISSIK
jgi:hypothetical protein